MNCLNLASKTIMITNASTSFAFCVAQHLARNGANVFLTDQDERRLNYTLNGLKQSDIPNEKFTGIAANLEVEEDRKLFFTKLYAQSNCIDSLIHMNKPNPLRGNIMEACESDFKKIYNQFVCQPFLISQQALPLMEKSKNGSILFISSLCAFVPFIDVGLFSSVQTALLGLNKAMAQSLAEKNIRVNALCLGMFEDDGTSASWAGCSGAPQNRTVEEAEEIRSNLSMVIPLGRLGKAKDSLGLIELLVSDHSMYATGEVYTLTGGISVRI